VWLIRFYVSVCVGVAVWVGGGDSAVHHQSTILRGNMLCSLVRELKSVITRYSMFRWRWRFANQFVVFAFFS
jgi:hypothetical protein